MRRIYLLIYINVSVKIVEVSSNWKWVYLWKWVRILQTLYLGVSYCLNVTFVGDSKGCGRKMV